MCPRLNKLFEERFQMNILMLTESNFPLDTRIRQEADTLVQNGHHVSIIAIKENDQLFFESKNGINIYRVPKIEIFKYGKQAASTKLTFFSKRLKLLKAIVGYGFEYFYFTFICFCLSFFILIKDKFNVIHTHNPPDTLFIIPLFYKIFGIKFVYDHHDLSPDLFLEKYKSKGKIIYRLLLLLERLSCRSANLVIATNESYKKIEIKRCGVKPEDIFVVRNGPKLDELKITEPVQSLKNTKKTILCYIGAINNQDGLDYLLDAFSKIVHKYMMKNIILLIVGDGDYLYKIKELAKELSIDDFIIFTGYVSDRNEINRYLSSADIFVDSAPYSFLNDNSTFIKHMEYMVFQKPVVSFKLKESMFSLGDAGVFVEANDTDKYAKAIINLINDKDMRRKLGESGKKRIKELSWDKVSIPLLQAYKQIDELVKS